MLFHHFASEFLIHTPSAAPLPLFPAPRLRGGAPSREQSGCRTCPRDGSSSSPSFLPSSLSFSFVLPGSPMPPHPIPLTELLTQLCSSAGSVLPLLMRARPVTRAFLSPSPPPHSNSNSLPISSCRLSIFLMKIESILSSSLFPRIHFRWGQGGEAATAAGRATTGLERVKAVISKTAETPALR